MATIKHAFYKTIWQQLLLILIIIIQLTDFWKLDIEFEFTNYVEHVCTNKKFFD